MHMFSTFYLVYHVQINRDTACGTTLNCFPDDCSTNCNYLVMWRTSGDSEVEFTLKRKTQANSHYIAIGFSYDAQMVSLAMLLSFIITFF